LATPHQKPFSRRHAEHRMPGEAGRRPRPPARRTSAGDFARLRFGFERGEHASARTCHARRREALQP